MQSFKISTTLEIVCQLGKTRNGFKHTATLLRDGREVGEVKCTYLNRTWEAFEFDSVLRKLAESELVTPGEAAQIKTMIEGRTSDRGTDNFQTVAAVMALGDIFSGGDPKQANDWKTRMLKAGLGDQGLDMPADWDQLDEAEKTKRLDQVIDQLGGAK